ncbi:MAG: transcriptional repressor LexA [Rhodospirillaceae bacterium]|jgi:repressor LexA|nr:transcriptional repressor LexA [Rhodospirillaceae bacterium]
MLTRKQYELLIFIEKYLGDTSISPSFDEMMLAIHLKSKSSIHRLLVGLEERGFIRRLPYKARAIEVLEKQMLVPSSIYNHSKNYTDVITIPFYGKIAAGIPIEALNDNSNTICVPSTLLKTGEHYALTVNGDSMIEAGIFDGDTVIINRCNVAESGSIVVALIDESEATLKRLRYNINKSSIVLEPANKKYQPRIFQSERVRVQGRLIGLIRYY